MSESTINIKRCYKCRTTKPIASFNKDSSRSCGLDNKCKECNRVCARNRRRNMMANRPDDAARERRRHQDARAARDKAFPEKSRAKQRAFVLGSKPGMHKHHWSYNKKHWLSVFWLTQSDHNAAHRLIKYDPHYKMYRTADGTLLGSAEAHINYLSSCGIAGLLQEVNTK